MLLRPIWNDGQALTTPELQRPCDVAAGADDRLYETLLTAPSGRNRIMPALRLDKRGIFVSPGNLYSGANGSLCIQPARFVVEDPSSELALKMGGFFTNTDANDFAMYSARVTANSSGNPRVDLLYATLSRTAPSNIAAPPTGVYYGGIGQADPLTGAQQSRKIKDVSSGVITLQTINIYDVPTLTLTVLPGTPAGSPVAPSLPADSATAFNFSLATIDVANGYTLGTAIAQSAIKQTWYGTWPDSFKPDSLKPTPSFYQFGGNEVPNTRLTNMTPRAERWGGAHTIFVHFKLKGTTTNVVLDSDIDWRYRFIWIEMAYLGSGTLLPLEGRAGGLLMTAAAGTFDRQAWFVGDGTTGVLPGLAYISPGNGVGFSVNSSDGSLRVSKIGTAPTDGTNGDLIVIRVTASDQFLAGM